jgi:hypothetical protein
MENLRSRSVNIIKCLAILAALLLTSAEVLIFDYDTRERAAHYQADALRSVAPG